MTWTAGWRDEIWSGLGRARMRRGAARPVARSGGPPGGGPVHGGGQRRRGVVGWAARPGGAAAAPAQAARRASTVPLGARPPQSGRQLPAPQDARPLFIFPWEGVTLYGTTDVDHDQTLDEEVALSASDVQATFAGIRPVVASAKASPSRASREHVLWQEDGLLTVTGGKLTTFRLMAQPALRAVRARPAHGPFGRPDSRPRQPVLDAPTGKPDWPQELNPEPRTRLLGRYGAFSPSARTSLNSQAGAATSRRAADDTIPRFAAGEA